MKVRIVDQLFAHTYTIGNCYQENKSDLIWDREDNSLETVIFTDSSLGDVNNKQWDGKQKIALLMESPFVTSSAYQFIKQNHNLFDYVITFSKDLLGMGDKFLEYQLGGCWINFEQHKIYLKNKLISMIGSNKSITKSHQFRKQVINTVKSLGVEIFGKGYRPIQNKLEGLQNYAFSIVMENGISDYYFSEKLIDALVTGTIPIYYGCDLNKFFNMEGIITFKNIEELNIIIKNISMEDYNKRIQSIKDNFEIAKKYIITENSIKYSLDKKIR